MKLQKEKEDVQKQSLAWEETRGKLRQAEIELEAVVRF